MKSINDNRILPALAVNVIVDTAFVCSQPNGAYASGGIYMMDNNRSGGSSWSQSEPGVYDYLGLITAATVGQHVTFSTFPIDSLGDLGDSVRIAVIEYSSGVDIFGSENQPKVADQANGPWVGEIAAAGSMAYKIEIAVRLNKNFAEQYYSWNAFFNATA